jgi:hypothetical protein
MIGKPRLAPLLDPVAVENEGSIALDAVAEIPGAHKRHAFSVNEGYNLSNEKKIHIRVTKQPQKIRRRVTGRHRQTDAKKTCVGCAAENEKCR